LRDDPHVLVARYWRAICHLYSGNLAAAAADLDEAIANFGRVTIPVGLRGIVHAFAGETEQARKILAEIRSRANVEYVDPYWFFTLYAAIDGFDAAVPYLEQMIETRSVMACYLRAVPRYREYRSDPRFMSALRTIWPDDF